MKQLLKLYAALLAGLLVLLGCGLVYLYFHDMPPKDSELVANFYAHRAAYERLREMLQQDEHVVRVLGDGIETTESPLVRQPSDAGFPTARHYEYLALFRETGAEIGIRESHESVGIGVWGSGFAGWTRHIELCWLKQPPANQVASLDDFYKTEKPRSPVFRDVEGNWYLWADW